MKLKVQYAGKGKSYSERKRKGSKWAPGLEIVGFLRAKKGK